MKIKIPFPKSIFIFCQKNYKIRNLVKLTENTIKNFMKAINYHFKTYFKTLTNKLFKNFFIFH